MLLLLLVLQTCVFGVRLNVYFLSQTLTLQRYALAKYVSKYAYIFLRWHLLNFEISTHPYICIV